MIVAFDLDDTLYPEISYVHSGFKCVARTLQREMGLDADVSFAVMRSSLECNGRGRQFDDLLEHWGMRTRTRVRELVRIYRHHEPDISLPGSSRDVLEKVHSEGHCLYLVTDGHKIVQAKKLDALALWPYFIHCYLTNRYGMTARKPSPRCFELMLKREGAPAADLVYVGDDPTKDFIGVRALGGRTIRVMTGRHRTAQARPGHEANYEVPCLPQVLDSLRELTAP